MTQDHDCCYPRLFQSFQSYVLININEIVCFLDAHVGEFLRKVGGRGLEIMENLEHYRLCWKIVRLEGICILLARLVLATYEIRGN